MLKRHEQHFDEVVCLNAWTRLHMPTWMLILFFFSFFLMWVCVCVWYCTSYQIIKYKRYILRKTISDLNGENVLICVCLFITFRLSVFIYAKSSTALLLNIWWAEFNIHWKCTSFIQHWQYPASKCSMRRIFGITTNITIFVLFFSSSSSSSSLLQMIITSVMNKRNSMNELDPHTYT